MLTMGELVICSTILTLAFMAMLVVFIKNAVEQKTNIPNLLLSTLRMKKSRAIIRKVSKAPEESGAAEKGTGAEGETMSGEIKTTIGTEPKDKENAPGFLASLTSAMLLWQPKSLFGRKNDKQREMSKYIDGELEKLLSESALDKPEGSPRENNALQPQDEMRLANAEREARLKELFKKGQANGQQDAVGPGAAGDNADKASREGPAEVFRVEKIEFPQGETPKWDAIVPKKDPSLLSNDAAAMEPMVGEISEANGEAMKKPLATAIDSEGQLKVNDMPVWGHTDLGKPLESFRSSKVNLEAAAPNERSSMDLQSNSERGEMKDLVENTPSPKPEIAKPAMAAPAAAPAKAAESPIKEIAGGMDIGNDILKELQEDMKAEDDVAMEIMGDLKDKHIDVHELELDSMDVLSRINMNVKTINKAKKKRSKPKV